jgi:DNA polymerase-4
MSKLTAHNQHLPVNTEPPQILHIDLNSCFAMVEQQARPLLRGRPVGVTNRKTTNACVVAASYEAKAKGVKVGMNFKEARELVPDLILVETDPPKYHFVYQKLVHIMRNYSPNIAMKSIDEGIINFAGTRIVNKRPLEDIGYEIKRRLRDDVGTWVTCNIGIAPNRFLAKQAAALHKPDGLDVIDHTNLRQTLADLELTDLFGIAERNQARLNAYGIYTPLQFLDTPAQVLRKQVFKSVVGEDWYRRLRGHEVDDYHSSTKTVGRQYVLDYESANSEERLRSRLAYLAETTAMKLRYNNLSARGVSVFVTYNGGDHWHERKMFKTSFFSNAEVVRRTMLLFNRRPRFERPMVIGVSCYQLTPSSMNQVSLLEDVNREVWLTQAMDIINEQFGEFTITYANSLASKAIVKQKIPFGSTRYFELLCNRA